MPPARIALWVASLTGIAILLRSLLLDPLPLWVPLAALVAYFSFATFGVLVPQLEMYGDVLWRGAAGGRRIALSFDDGPDPKTTPRVLEILAERGQKATFFVVGRKARLHPEIVRDIHTAGHGLGAHGWDHDRLYSWKSPSAVQKDVELTLKAIEDACGARPKLLRPPIGHVSSRTASAARKLGLTLVAWSVRARDGLGERDADRVVRRVERGLQDGAIVALHDASEKGDFEPASIGALPRILDAVERLGLSCVTVEQIAEPPSSAV